MIAYFLNPAGQIGRRAYVAPIAAFLALAVVSALATGATVSASSIGAVLDRPWTAIGRGLDASFLSILPIALAAPLVIAVFAAAIWAAFALTVKRLHDLGQSGWWSALLLVPGVAAVLIVVCAIAPGRGAAARLQMRAA